MLAPEILALAQETRAGGVFQIEVDTKRPDHRVLRRDRSGVRARPPAFARPTSPRLGGRIARVEKMVIDSVTYYEILKDRDGLAVEILTSIDGRVEGREDQLDADDAPAGVLAAADRAVPGGTLWPSSACKAPRPGVASSTTSRRCSTAKSAASV